MYVTDVIKRGRDADQRRHPLKRVRGLAVVIRPGQSLTAPVAGARGSLGTRYGTNAPATKSSVAIRRPLKELIMVTVIAERVIGRLALHGVEEPCCECEECGCEQQLDDAAAEP